MEMVKIAGFAVAAAMLALTVRAVNRDLGMALSLAAGAMLLAVAAQKLGAVVGALQGIAGRAQGAGELMGTLLKVIGAAYAAEFSAQACRDAGEAGIASKVELCGKVLVVTLALPLVTAITDMVLSLTA